MPRRRKSKDEVAQKDDEVGNTQDINENVIDNIDDTQNQTSDNLADVEDPNDSLEVEESDNLDDGGLVEDSDDELQEENEDESDSLSDNSPRPLEGAAGGIDIGLTEEEMENLTMVEEDEQPEEVITSDDEYIPPPSAALVEPIEEYGGKTALQELNEERAIQQRMSSINFLIEYSKNPDRSISTVAHKMNVTASTGRNYVNRFITLVKESIAKGEYPKHVLRQYNDENIEEEKRLKYYHVDRLKDIVLRYGNYDVNKNLNNDDTDTFISRKKRLSSDNLSLLGSPEPQQQLQLETQEFRIIDRLNYNINSLQLIHFGLFTIFGQAVCKRVARMLGDNPAEYLQSEAKMAELLTLCSVTEVAAKKFIDWLKVNAKYVAHPEGFLAYSRPSGAFGGQPNAPMGQPQQSYGSNNNPMTEFYYQTGVFLPNLPPEHPMNVKRLTDYEERQREDEQMKSMDKKLNMIMRTKMMDVMDVSNKPQGGNGFLSPEMMLLMGLAEYKQSVDVDGKPVMTLVPRMPGQQQAAPAAGGPGTMTEMMAMMKEMISFMAGMQKANGGQGNDLVSTIMPQIIGRVFESPTSKMDEFLKTVEMVNKIKGPEAGVAAAGGYQMPPEVLVQTERMKLDKEFAMRQFDIQQQKLQLEQQRLEKQDQEASHNVDKLMEGIQQVAPMLMGIFQQFMMGNKGGAPMGGAMPPGMPPQQQPGVNPAEMLLKMQFEEQRRREKEEAERKQREYYEEIARKNQPNPYQQYQQPAATPPVEQVQRVQVQERAEQEIVQQEPEIYEEHHFITYSPSELEEAKRRAEKERRKLESYITSVNSVLQNKLMSGESYEPVQQVITSAPLPVPVEEVAQELEQEEKEETIEDIEAILDGPKNYVDPDYDGVDEVETDTEEETKEEAIELADE